MAGAGGAPWSGPAAGRVDGRGAAQLRAMGARCGVLSRSDGSCRFALGDTVCVASVFGPTELTLARKELADRASIAVTYYSGSRREEGEGEGAAGEAQRDVESEALLAGLLEQVVLTRLHPRKVIKVSVQVVQDCGSAQACALLAASGALLDAGVELVGAASAACVALSAQGAILVDPSKHEEEAALARVLVCTRDDDGRLLAAITSGPLERAVLKDCLASAVAAAAACRSFLRVSWKETVTRRMALQTPANATATLAAS
jgi:exosome complex component RRP41